VLEQFRESISAICIAAAWSDGKLEDYEKQALDRIHVQLGFSRAEIMGRIGEAIKSGPTQESVEIPNDTEAQKEFMRLALAVCLADGDVNSHEVNFLSKLANFLSLSSETLQDLREKAEQLLDPGNVPTEEVAPQRIEALLPEQKIKLDEEHQESPSSRPRYDRKDCCRKPLSELLYEGEDYGGELSLT